MPAPVNAAVALTATLALLGGFASSASADVRMVTLEGDHIDPVFFTPNTPGELRYEIANAAPGDTVRMAPGVDPVLGSASDIRIDKNLIVEGQDANATTVSVPGLNHRIFRIGSMDPSAVVTIRDLTMTGGHAFDGLDGLGSTPAEPGQGGGAILNDAELTLDRVALINNRAGDGGSGADGANGNPGQPGNPGGSGGFGGAVYNLVGGTLTVTDSTFEGNFAGDGGTGGQGGNGTGMFPIAGAGGTGGAGQDGGAISNAGILTVTNSTFFDNHSGEGGAGGDKGDVGIGPGGDGGDGGDGGAIHQAGAGSVTLTSTTIASNVAAVGGAGGTGSIPSADGDPGAGGTGGGTFFFAGPPATVANTLYSLNSAVSGSNCAGGPITAVGANLSFPVGGCPASFSNGDPQLGGLADNGGPTRTMALSSGSAAIDQVALGSPNCPGTDQRGVDRPQGTTCDIGAFELEMTAPPPTPPADGVDAAAPDTTITKKPKDKTNKRSARFEFTANEPGSTFECSLDDGPFQPCTSPKSVKVKKGKHRFDVRAIDPAGNIDPSAATDGWKVKKRKK